MGGDLSATRYPVPMTTPRLFEHVELDSTNEHAFREMDAGRAEHLDAHLARFQTAGRGRLGRPWVGAPGQGMLLSVVLLGRDSWTLPLPAVLSMTVGLALRSAVVRAGLEPGRVLLDWPNDLVVAEPLEDRGARGGSDYEAPKVAGILVESRNLDPDAPAYVVGIGANVLQRDFPAELLAERPVSSLALLGCTTTPRDLAALIVEELGELLEVGALSPSEILGDYLEATGIAGQDVRVGLSGGKTAIGRALFLETDGLRIEGPDGARQLFALEHIQKLQRI
ncbi:MAG: BirA family biotin operon repressor/biotin-[acetyl-CoA-carboxylase] ligase [Planctomycetota bacterium]|jgi:BirA family biotin operon repressor/biotin-[acetyl-CoA-carboxylase] ligase